MSVNLQASTPARFVSRLSRWLLPSRCLICSEPGHESDLCADCARTLPFNTPACPACALPLATATVCGSCLQQPPPYSQALAIWRYEGAIAQLLRRFKFHHDLAAGRVLAEHALTRQQQWTGWQGIDCLVPMPLHTTRLGQRGYNQALELARPWAKVLQRPLRPEALQRTRATRPQTELDAQARKRNVRGAFAASALKGGTVLLVDDVMTTGTSVGEAAHTLLRAGAGEVRVLVMARAPEPGQHA